MSLERRRGSALSLKTKPGTPALFAPEPYVGVLLETDPCGLVFSVSNVSPSGNQLQE